jgi:hypothetical protein
MSNEPAPPIRPAQVKAEEPIKPVADGSERSSSPLSIRAPELKAITVDTPEEREKKVELSQGSYNTLVNTITYHFDKINGMKNSVPPEAVIASEEEFYQTLIRISKQSPETDLGDLKDLDPSKPEEYAQKLRKLEEVAKKFLERGGAEVRSIVKLAEIEGMSLQAATGREIVIKGDKKYIAIEKEGKEITLLITEDGAVVTDEEFKKRWWHQGKKVLRRAKLKVVGGNRMEMDPSNSLLTNEQRNFLRACGYGTGNLSTDQLLAIDKRLAAIAALRMELYVKTGLTDLSQIELNFIKKDSGAGSAFGRKYLDTKTAYFIREGTAGTNVREILEAEGVAVTTEVKNKVQKEIEKRLKEEQETVMAQTTSGQLQERIKEIEESAKMEDVEKEERKNIILREIRRLEEEYKLFGRKDSLPGEKSEAEKTRDETKRGLRDRAPHAGATEDELIKWSSTDPAEIESWRSTKVQLDKLEKEKTALQAQIEDFKSELKDLEAEKLPDLVVITSKDPAGIVTAVQDPHAGAIARVDRHNAREKELRDKIDELRKKIHEDHWPGGGGLTLDKWISGLNDRYTTRKQKVEDDSTTKQLCDTYHQMVRKIEDLEHERLSTEDKITHLPGGETTKDDIIKKIKALREEQEHLGEPTGQKKLEIQALKALIPTFDQAKKVERDERIRRLEQGIIVTRSAPDWVAYPPTLRRVIHLLWGDEVMLMYPESKDLVEQVKVFMKTSKYLDVIIDTIETETGIFGGGFDANRNALMTDGLYNNISNVFYATAGITSLPVSRIDRDLVLKIMENLRVKALNITAI